MPFSWQSERTWLSHKHGSRLPLLCAKPAPMVPCQPKSITAPWQMKL